jgi:hypothetical protein
MHRTGHVSIFKGMQVLNCVIRAFHATDAGQLHAAAASSSSTTADICWCL